MTQHDGGQVIRPETAVIRTAVTQGFDHAAGDIAELIGGSSLGAVEETGKSAHIKYLLVGLESLFQRWVRSDS